MLARCNGRTSPARVAKLLIKVSPKFSFFHDWRPIFYNLCMFMDPMLFCGIRTTS